MRGIFSILFLVAVMFLAHPVGEAVQRRWVHPNHFPFRSFQWEQDGKIYNAFAISKWKDKMPDMSKILPDMQPKRISNASLQEIETLLRETCIAESVHWVEIFLGGGCLAISPGIGGLIWAIWAFFGNLPFILIQRYNRPRLQKLHRRLAIRQGITGE